MRTFAHAHHDVVFITSFSLEEDYRVTTRVFIIEFIQLPWFILYSPLRNPTWSKRDGFISCSRRTFIYLFIEVIGDTRVVVVV